MRSLTIGFYLYDYHPQLSGGIDVSFIRQIRALSHYHPEHHYILIAHQAAAPTLRSLFADEAACTVSVLEVDPSRLARLGYLIRRYMTHSRDLLIVQKLRDLHLDILHYPRQTLFYHLDDIPNILTLYDIQHEYYPQFFSEAVQAKRQADYRQSIELADQIVVAAQYTQETVQETLPDHAKKVTVIYPGFDDQSISLADDVVETLLSTYDLPEQFILYPANPWLHKNHARLLAALRRLRDSGLTVPLVCTGSLKSIASATLRDKFLAADVEDMAYDLGFVDEMTLKALYHRARMMVFPSLFEGFGFPVLEAQANGCPVVCSNATSLPEVVGDGAYFFDPFSVNDIASTLKVVWHDETRREDLKQRGYANLKRFKWQTYADQMNELYLSHSFSY